MAGTTQFELRSTGTQFDDGDEATLLPWLDAAEPAEAPPFIVRQSGGTVWASVNKDRNSLDRLTGPQGAEFAFRFLQRRFSTDLAMMTNRHDVLVNGLPTLKLTLLTTKDSVRLAPGFLVYVSERITPYVGAATEEHLGRKCPFCKLKITKETYVAVCRCGGAYHLESQENLPDLSSEDRLECADKVQTCVACGNQLVLSEHLLWDPASL